MYNLTNIIFTWGSPILGGFVSQRADGYRNQIMVVNIIQAVSISLIVLATPETTFDRPKASVSNNNFETTISTTAAPVSRIKSNLKILRLVNSNVTRKFQATRAFLPLRALCAPTAVLTFLMAGPLVATAFAVAHMIPLLFSPSPILALPTQLGLMFTGALVGSLISYCIIATAIAIRSRPPNHLLSKGQSHLNYVVLGIVVGFAGVLAFGFYVDGTVRPNNFSGDEISFFTQGKDFNENFTSFLFGLLVSGAVIIDFGSINHIRATVPSSESDLVEGAHNALKNLLIGIFVIAMPFWVDGSESNFPGLKDTAIALGIVQIAIAGAVTAILWVCKEKISNIDSKVLRRKSTNDANGIRMHQQWKSTDSFFEG